MTARMKYAIIVLIASIGFASHSVAEDPKPKKTELEGTWNAIKADSRAKQLIFTTNKFEAKIDDSVVKGTFTINTEENPSWIDLKITETDDNKFKDKTLLGIYEFDGADLRWCSSQPGRKRRPQQFASQMGDALLILVKFMLKE